MKKSIIIITLAFLISCTQTRNQAQTANNAVTEQPREFDEIRPFRDGLAAVQLDGKWGFIDRDSNLVIPPQFYRALSFSGNFARVGFERRIESETLFIDRTGTIISRDSVEAFHRREFFERFYAYPLISAEERARITPLIRSWTDFYGIDLSQARLVYKETGVCINSPFEESGFSFFNFDDDWELDAYATRADTFSPNRRLFLQFLPLWFDGRTGEYSMEWDGQDVWLFDLDQRHGQRIQENFRSSLTEAAFWESNDVFILVGNTHIWQIMEEFAYTICIFDMKNNTIVSYWIIVGEGMDSGGYIEEFVRRRGIVISHW
jgi:hypothetical protein